MMLSLWKLSGCSLLSTYPYFLLTLLKVFLKLSKYLCTSSATNFTFFKAMEPGNSIFTDCQQCLSITEWQCLSTAIPSLWGATAGAHWPEQHGPWAFHWGYRAYCWCYIQLLYEPHSLLHPGFCLLPWKIFLTWVYRRTTQSIPRSGNKQALIKPKKPPSNTNKPKDVQC